MTETAAVRALMDNRFTPEKDQAIRLARELGPRAGSELKGAVIEAAWAEWRGDSRPEGRNLAAVIDYAYAVGGLQDPRAIPFLIEILPNGLFASRALADFGSLVFAPVLTAAAAPDGDPSRVAGCLTALRFMLEDATLSPRQVTEVRNVARNGLTGQRNYRIVVEAMQLGRTLNDLELRTRIETLATDRAAVEALVLPYLDHAYELDYVQRRARDLLSGW